MSAFSEISQLSTADATVSRHYIRSLPVLVLFPHNRCNCRCVMCDIWRLRQVREITARDLEPHRDCLRALKVRWVVFSGGEALMHTDLAALSRLLHSEGIRLTLLTAGLTLAHHARLVAENLDDVIVSLDGPPEIHDCIRHVPRAYDRLARGIACLRKFRPEIQINGRCTVQKANFQHLREVVQAARRLALNSLSFLAVDLTSGAFNRPGGWPLERQAGVALTAEEVELLDREIDLLIREYSTDIHTGFVAESEEKLRRIVLHFQAHLGQVPPVAPRCNAPWVSAVVEADGTLRPCFFHRAIGNIHGKTLFEILNGPEALRFREELDIPNNLVCQKCVCSLYIPNQH